MGSVDPEGRPAHQILPETRLAQNPIEAPLCRRRLLLVHVRARLVQGSKIELICGSRRRRWLSVRLADEVQKGCSTDRSDPC